MWWGFSEALDLSSEIENCSDNHGENNQNTDKNVLLIGQFDGRHILKTIAQKYEHSDNLQLNFFVHEPLLENVARQLLFITLALEPQEHVGIAEKTIFFLELYGNSLLRPATKKYLNKVSKRLLNFVTNNDYAEKILPNVSIQNLKYKEKDQLEVIFKYWAANDNNFDIQTCWNERVRKELGVRYDARFGVFDWDYHMRYHPFGADSLKIQEYKRFREKGLAFYFEDTCPCIPNNTLASAIFASGSKVLSYGYLGDITTGSYPAYGFKCKDKDMFKKINGQTSKSATNITERNVMRMFYEILHKKSFIPPDEINEGPAAVLMEDTLGCLKITENDSLQFESKQIRIKDACEVYESLSTNNSKIIFLPTTALKEYVNKQQYERFFDLVFVSQAMVLKHIKPEIFKMFKPNCKIIIDTPKYLLNYRKENLETFKNDLEALMSSCHCKPVTEYDPNQDEFVHFKLD